MPGDRRRRRWTPKLQHDIDDRFHGQKTVKWSDREPADVSVNPDDPQDWQAGGYGVRSIEHGWQQPKEATEYWNNPVESAAWDYVSNNEVLNVVEWDSSGAWEALCAAEQRRMAKSRGLPYLEPNPDLYIAKIDWDLHEQLDFPESADSLVPKGSKRFQAKRGHGWGITQNLPSTVPLEQSQSGHSTFAAIKPTGWGTLPVSNEDPTGLGNVSPPTDNNIGTCIYGHSNGNRQATSMSVDWDGWNEQANIHRCSQGLDMWNEHPSTLVPNLNGYQEGHDSLHASIQWNDQPVLYRQPSVPVPTGWNVLPVVESPRYNSTGPASSIHDYPSTRWENHFWNDHGKGPWPQGIAWREQKPKCRLQKGAGRRARHVTSITNLSSQELFKNRNTQDIPRTQRWEGDNNGWRKQAKPSGPSSWKQQTEWTKRPEFGKDVCENFNDSCMHIPWHGDSGVQSSNAWSQTQKTASVIPAVHVCSINSASMGCPACPRKPDGSGIFLGAPVLQNQPKKLYSQLYNRLEWRPAVT